MLDASIGKVKKLGVYPFELGVPHCTAFVYTPGIRRTGLLDRYKSGYELHDRKALCLTVGGEFLKPFPR
jgi:hypothetical protein